ncbi:MAG: hypothetical protein C0467_01595 [Planctomycetaceae bacterium]|nr:hypothetical protein [Planctomycetaceae bacterium]
MAAKHHNENENGANAMFTTRTLTAALFALTLIAGSATAQTRPATVKAPVSPVQLPKPKVNLNPALTNPGAALQIPESVKAKLNAPDLVLTELKVGAGNAVFITVTNSGRSATTRTVRLKVVSSGNGNLDNPSRSQTFEVPPMAVGEVKVFQTTQPLVQSARDDANSTGVILIAANVDQSNVVDELSEANNVKVISTK